MAGAIIIGLDSAATSADISLHIVDRNADKRSALLRQIRNAGATGYGDVQEVSTKPDLIILSVKPVDIADACGEITASSLSPDCPIISVAAGITVATIRHYLGNYDKLVRIMPNTPAHVGYGMSVCYATPATSAAEREEITRIFQSVGAVLWVAQEELVNASIAIMGSSPAYFFYFAEIMLRTAQELGFSEAQATEMIAQAIRGSGEMLRQAGKPPAQLRQEVSSARGTTLAALEVMDKMEVQRALAEAMQACYARALEISDELSPPKDSV